LTIFSKDDRKQKKIWRKKSRENDQNSPLQDDSDPI
jgi:hypothetical protein